MGLQPVIDHRRSAAAADEFDAMGVRVCPGFRGAGAAGFLWKSVIVRSWRTLKETDQETMNV